MNSNTNVVLYKIAEIEDNEWMLVLTGYFCIECGQWHILKQRDLDESPELNILSEVFSLETMSAIDLTIKKVAGEGFEPYYSMNETKVSYQKDESECDVLGTFGADGFIKTKTGKSNVGELGEKFNYNVYTKKIKKV